MAICRWVGLAVAIVDKWTITVAGTWASGDTVTISIGNKDLVITLGASASTVVADIATEIANAINASVNTPGTGFTWSHAGQQFPEFQEIGSTGAVAVGAVVTITSTIAGVPIGLVVTEVTAGDGTATEANTQAATGPEHLDNADNYQGGVLPADNDTLYFDNGNVSAKYGLTYFRTNSIDLNVIIKDDWLGQLGLPVIRESFSVTYAEYRQRYFQMRGTLKNLSIIGGVSGATNQGNLWIDCQDQQLTSIQVKSRRGAGGTTPKIFIAGSDASNEHADFVVMSGCVSIEPDDAQTNSSKYFKATTWLIGSESTGDSDCVVYIGANTRLSAGTVLSIGGGTVITEAATKASGTDIRVKIIGGSLELKSAGTEGEISIDLGATLFVSPLVAGGTIDLLTVKGTLDCRRTNIGKLATALKIYGGASYYDPDGSFGGVIDFVECDISQLAGYQFPTNRQLDFSAAATP